MAKTVIIGGGVAGLTAGIYSRLAGQEAVIYEKHREAGGNLTGWQRGEYHIDNCIHWLTGTNQNTATYRMWEDVGALGGVPLCSCEALYTCKYGGITLMLTEDLNKLRDDMIAISPDDRAETEDLISAVKAIQGISGIAGEGHDEKSGMLERILALPLLRKYFSLSAGELAGRFVSPVLKRFISSFLTERFMSLALVIVIAHYTAGNAGVPEGGSRAMAERMTARFIELGGSLVTGREVVGIIRKGRRAKAVTFSDGSEAEGDYFIVTADPASVYGKLTDLPMPQRLGRAYSDRRLLRFSCRQAAFSCGVGRMPFSGDIPVDVPEKFRELFDSSYIMLREFSHEKSYAPEGKSIVQVMDFCGERQCRKYIHLRSDSAAYSEMKEKFARAAAEIIEQAFPDCEGKLSLLDVWTPATYKRYTGSEVGSFMSFALSAGAIPRRTGYVSGFSNVYLASQWNAAPGGLPIAAAAGKRAARLIAARESRKQGVRHEQTTPATV